MWKDFYEAKKWSANLGYNYAITAHKAQGSSYENVLILENDLNLNSNIVERNRIKYTSYTRASNKLFIYRK
jgi:ATP-dependent exoDNAse (exonuclease V) alpha subunit